MRRHLAAALVVAALAVPGLAQQGLAQQGLAQQQEPFEPEGYRTDNYRAPVPATQEGARVLTTAETETSWRTMSGAFIDVLPRAPKLKNLPAGTVWRDAPRKNIPGSIWLPDTGYGVLPPAMDDYLRRGLAQASHGNKSALLVIASSQVRRATASATSSACPTRRCPSRCKSPCRRHGRHPASRRPWPC